MASLVEVLAMVPVTPTTSGSKRARQPAASRGERREHVRHLDDRDVAEPVERAGVGRARPRGAPRRRRGGLAEEPVAVGALAGQGHEELAGPDEPRVDRRAADAADRSGGARRPPVTATMPPRSVTGPTSRPGWTRSDGLGGGRRDTPEVCAQGPDRGGTGPRSPARRSARRRTGHPAIIRRPGGRRRAADGRSGAARAWCIASVAMRRKSSDDLTARISSPGPVDRRGAVVDLDRDDDDRAVRPVGRRSRRTRS